MVPSECAVGARTLCEFEGGCEGGGAACADDFGGGGDAGVVREVGLGADGVGDESGVESGAFGEEGCEGFVLGFCGGGFGMGWRFLLGEGLGFARWCFGFSYEVIGLV